MIVVRWQSRGKPTASSLTDRCADLIRGLQLPRGRLTMRSVVDCLEHQRGQTIHLMTLRLPRGAPTGLWLAADGDDYVVAEERLSPVHRRQVWLHELAHVAWDHEDKPVISPEASRVLLPDLDPAMVSRVLGREHSNTDAEQEAETLGTALGVRIVDWGEPAVFDLAPETRELREQMAVLLGIPRQSGEGLL